METQDYMMRYFEELGKVLSVLLSFREQGRYQEGLILTNRNLKDKIDIELIELIEKKDDDLLEFISNEKKYNTPVIEIISEILTEAGKNYVEIKDFDSAKKSFKNAKFLILFSRSKDKTYYFERSERIKNLENLLNDLPG